MTGTRWLSAVVACVALFPLYDLITHHGWMDFFLAAFLLGFALLMDLRKTFTFDGVRRVVRWNGRKILKGESGEIPFADINNIGTQVTTAGQNQRVPIYRLTIETSQATIPMAYTYAGQPDGYAALRKQILEFIKGGATLQPSATLAAKPDRH